MRFNIFLTGLFFSLSLLSMATDTDDEIIKNLDFFQSMEIIKDERTLAALVNEKNEKIVHGSLKNTSDKEVEKKR